MRFNVWFSHVLINVSRHINRVRQWERFVHQRLGKYCELSLLQSYIIYFPSND